VVFENAYCASPVCGPARASLFTGMYPPSHGVVRNHVCMSAKRPLLTDRLSEAGYYNALIGKLHLSPCRSRHGFDFKALCDSPHAVYDPEEVVNNPYRQWIDKELFGGNTEQAERIIADSEKKPSSDPAFWLGTDWCDDAHHLTTWTGDQAVDLISKWSQEKPLFLNISFFGPHHPYSTCPPWDSMYDPQTIELPKTLRMSCGGPIFERIGKGRSRRSWPDAVWRQIIAYYLGAISQIDRQIGRIADALKKADMWDNSIVVFTADHGDELGDFGFIGKDLMNEGSSRVPLFIKLTGSEKRGNRRREIVNSIDLFATLLEFARGSNWKMPADERIESRSLVGLANGAADDWDNQTFVTHGVSPQKSMQLLRKDRFKLVRMNLPDSEPLYELYDMGDDLPDVRNVFNEPSCRAVRDSMLETLNSWWDRQTGYFPDRAVLQRLTVRPFAF